MGRGKKIRHERESGPIRFSDHIRNWFLYNDPLTCDSEVDILERYFKLANWGDTSVYKDPDTGEDLPEILTAMFACRSYDNMRQQRGNVKPEDRLD